MTVVRRSSFLGSLSIDTRSRRGDGNASWSARPKSLRVASTMGTFGLASHNHNVSSAAFQRTSIELPVFSAISTKVVCQTPRTRGCAAEPDAGGRPKPELPSSGSRQYQHTPPSTSAGFTLHGERCFPADFRLGERSSKPNRRKQESGSNGGLETLGGRLWSRTGASHGGSAGNSRLGSTCGGRRVVEGPALGTLIRYS